MDERDHGPTRADSCLYIVSPAVAAAARCACAWSTERLVFVQGAHLFSPSSLENFPCDSIVCSSFACTVVDAMACKPLLISVVSPFKIPDCNNLRFDDRVAREPLHTCSFFFIFPNNQMTEFSGDAVATSVLIFPLSSLQILKSSSPFAAYKS